MLGPAPNGSTPGKPSPPPEPSQNPEVALVRGLLRSTHIHAMVTTPNGWHHLHHLAALVRSHAARGVVDGWKLLCQLLADVADDLVATFAGTIDSASSTGSSAPSDLLRDNVAGTALSLDCIQVHEEQVKIAMGHGVTMIWGAGFLGVVDELMAGTVVTPPGHFLLPPDPLVDWALSPSRGGECPPDLWAVVGVTTPLSYDTPRVCLLLHAPP